MITLYVQNLCVVCQICTSCFMNYIACGTHSMAIIYGTPRAPYFYHVEVRMAFQSTLSTLCLIFIARQHILTRDIDIASLSVCPS